MSEIVEGKTEDNVLPTETRRWDFYLFCLTTFLSFLGTSSLPFFSVVFAGYGMRVDEIGWIYSAPLVPIVVGTLFCGSLLGRFSSFQIAFAGQALTLAAYASYLVTIADPIGALLSTFVRGAGNGLFFPAALIYVRTSISGPNTVFLFGIYTTMITLPILFGPGLAEILFSRYGVYAMLWSFTILIAASLVLMSFLRRPEVPATNVSAKPTSYLAILQTPSALPPNAAIAVAGSMWGFMLSFMALYLSSIGTPVTVFFSAATVSMVVSRYTFMAWLGRKPKQITAGVGLILMGLGYAVLPFCGSNLLFVGTSALVFGLGYSTVFPALSLWTTDHFPLAQRGRAMALFSSFFQGGISIVPLAVGAALRVFDFETVLLSLAAISFLVGVYMMMWRPVMLSSDNA